MWVGVVTGWPAVVLPGHPLPALLPLPAARHSTESKSQCLREREETDSEAQCKGTALEKSDCVFPATAVAAQRKGRV